MSGRIAGAISVSIQLLLRSRWLQETSDAPFSSIPAKVYLTAVVILVAAMRHGATPSRVRELSQLVGANRRTMDRWLAYWRQRFPRDALLESGSRPHRPLHRDPCITTIAHGCLLSYGFNGRKLGKSTEISLADLDQRGLSDQGGHNQAGSPAEDAACSPCLNDSWT